MDHAIWFGVVLVAVTIFNMFPVRVRIPQELYGMTWLTLT